MEKWEWLIDVFTFIGMAVCILIAIIAIIWITCFLVKLLVKTLGVKFGKSYDIMVEDINKKSEAKKARNEIKRQAKFAQKMEILNMKLENNQKIHEMKKAKLEKKLTDKENATKTKLFGENAPVFEVKTEVKKEKIVNLDKKSKNNEKDETENTETISKEDSLKTNEIQETEK